MSHHTAIQPTVLPSAPNESEVLPLPGRIVWKEEFELAAGQLTGELLERMSALEAYVRIRNVAEILDVATTLLKEQAITAVHGSAESILGAKVVVKALPKKFQYDDPVINDLETRKKEIEGKLKQRKQLLETISADFVDITTGEFLRPALCISAGCTLQVSFTRPA